MPTHPATLESSGTPYRIVDLPGSTGPNLVRLPWLLRILLENALRRAAPADADGVKTAMLDWLATGTSTVEIPFAPVRVLMHDTTCLPALADIAAMRAKLAAAGGDPATLVPRLPVDVSVDHSVAVDHYGSPRAFVDNMAREIERNGECYRFMKWAGRVMPGLTIHPPGTGIMHTLNMEQLATVVATARDDGAIWAFPDTLIGTDSHTPMINGIGVLGWGVGGLEAEGAMFGLPVTLRLPDVIGVRLTGALKPGRLATDLALTVTERLRRYGLSGEFVEFFGPGVSTLTAGDRCVTANMAPEYGASSGYFAIDARSCRYLTATGRSARHVKLVEDYARRQGLWFDPAASPRYTDVVEIDLTAVEVSIAGPRRPQDRLSPSRIGDVLPKRRAPANAHPLVAAIPDHAIALAAITSCTNTSDPALLIAAGLFARKARRRDLKPPAWVKTSLAPGSPSAKRLLERAGLLEDLSALGFDIVGYGCTTCIGNSGPLAPAMADALQHDDGLQPVAVLSGNRNFPGRIHPDIETAFLASPPLVLAYALAGDADRDILSDPIGRSADGRSVHLADLWPSTDEIDAALLAASHAGDIKDAFEQASQSPAWSGLQAPATALYPWDLASTYLRPPPFAAFAHRPPRETWLAHPLLVLGDDITTDHISPAGQIPAASDAGRHLLGHQERPADLNVYASRRGNWQVMLRGAFANTSIVNRLGADIPGGATIHAPSGEVLPVWRAAERYAAEGQAIVLVAGERYGTGSSRDWAAKALAILGVKAALAVSFERIHRTNLIGMGILPLRLDPAHHPDALALAPGDRLQIEADWTNLAPRQTVHVEIHRASGETTTLDTTAAIETSLEVDLLRAGGMLPLILARAIGA